MTFKYYHNKVNNMKKLTITLLISLLITACATQETKQAALANNSGELSNLPNWVLLPQIDNGI